MDKLILPVHDVEPRIMTRDELRESLVLHGRYLLEESYISGQADWGCCIIKDVDFPTLIIEVLADLQKQFPGAVRELDRAHEFANYLLSNIRADNAQFFNCNFEGLCLHNSNFHEARFEDCNLQLTFSGSYDLQGAILMRPQLTVDARIVTMDMGAIAKIEDERFYNFQGNRLYGIQLNDMRQVVYTPTLQNSWKNRIEHGHSAGEAFRDFQESMGLLARAFGQRQPWLQAVKNYLLK